MEDGRRVPRAVMEKARGCDMNSAKYLGKFKGYEVWSIYDVDSDGSIVPTGLPSLILHNEHEIDVVYGEKAFRVFDSLDL